MVVLGVWAVSYERGTPVTAGVAEGDVGQPLGIAIAYIRAKVDGFEPRNQLVNLRIVCQATRWAHDVYGGLIQGYLAHKNPPP